MQMRRMGGIPLWSGSTGPLLRRTGRLAEPRFAWDKLPEEQQMDLLVDAPATAPRFQEVITTQSELRGIVGRPNRFMTSKVLTRLDRHCRQFIGKAPFVVIASTAENGQLDVSPKGDPAGFVQVVDDRTLAIPDRRGNRRVDTLCNVLANPSVGLIFFVPGKTETLRVAGKAAIVRDRSLRESLALEGRIPEVVLVVTVERVYFHCGRCITRSGLWN
jgi:uncharacterized protein